MTLSFTPSDGTRLVTARRPRGKKPLDEEVIAAVKQAETQPITISGLATEANANTLLSKIRGYANQQNKGVRGSVYQDGDVWAFEFNVTAKRAMKPREVSAETKPKTAKAKKAKADPAPELVPEPTPVPELFS